MAPIFRPRAASAGPRKLAITDVVLRDAHQSLLATRLKLEDLLPIAPKLDQVGYWSLESWGGATFDTCIRYLGEDPWERLRELKKAMPNTPQQMLLRGQNLLGYRHFADDVVDKFVERAAFNGVDVFRVFDAMNDARNLDRPMRAVVANGKHAQGTLCYTTSPVHTLQTWIDLARRLEDMGAHSICIKDMAGLLRPYEAFELVTRLKKAVKLPLHLHCHATTGLSTATIVKAVEAGVDIVDTAISTLSMTSGHSATEAVVAIMEGTDKDTGLDPLLLREIADHFREVRKKYEKFEGTLKGIDARILLSQVPGGMLSNMESQLREQNALHRFDEVLTEILHVREDLGYIPLVTPTSQIVGSQAVINVVSSTRYKIISNETRGLLRGEYGAAPAPYNPELLERALNGKEPITCRPADLLKPELERLSNELHDAATEKGFRLAVGEYEIDDVLTYAMFPQVGLKFLEVRPPLKTITTAKKRNPQRVNKADFTTRRGWPLSEYKIHEEA
ncbi:MAG: pyruvate carboxylase subunit B [Pedobacter sp.]|nr:pyruvate carboxylase subunit B [Pedobacter sp.]